MRNLFLALLIVPVVLGANPTFALELCAKIDKDTGEPKEGATIKLRATCKVKKNGDPVEVSIGTTEQLAGITELPCASQVGTDVFFEGCNVHVRSGEGATWGTGEFDNGSVNGLGNLIVGYDEDVRGGKTGSHNLVVGPGHSYPSYGSFIGGYSNTASGYYSSVSGGSSNIASAYSSSVSGGFINTASSDYSSVSGGQYNHASGIYSSVSGGQNNTASELYSSVSGGQNNTASAELSSVSGGVSNTASGLFSSLSGGQYNTASGSWSSISGGYQNTASGESSSVLGGQDNEASAEYSVAP